MRHLSYALACAALATALSAQDEQALHRLYRDSFANLPPTHVREFLEVARLLGLVRTTDDALVAKEIYQANTEPSGEAAGWAHTPVIVPAGQGGGNPLGGSETESNDTVGFADPLNLSSGSCVVTGSTGTGDVRDVYVFRLPTDSLVSVVATATATPSTCNLFDNVGRLAIVGLSPAVGTRGVRSACLPAGTYYVNVVGTAYTLTVTATPTIIPTLLPGPNAGVVNPAGLASDVFDVSCWQFTVTTPHADVLLDVASTAGTHNLFFNLGRSTAGRIHFCDNVLPLPVNTTDPVMKAGLPAGNYYVFVQNSVAAATATIPYTLTMTQTPITPMPLCASTNYTFSNSGHRDLFCVTLTATDHITIDTNNGTTPPSAMDSYIELFDAKMGLLMHNDDGCAAGTGCTPTFRSYLDVTLPPGTYYLTFRGFSAAGTAGEFGDYAVTGVCGLPTTTTPLEAVRLGPNAIAAGSHTFYCYRACTDSPIQILHNNNCHVVGSDGLLRASYQQLVSPGATTASGTMVAAFDALYVIQRTTGGAASTTANIWLSGKLGIELAPISGTGVYSLRSQDKIGRLQALFLSVGSGPSIPIAPFSGFVCLDLPTLLFVGFNPMATAYYTWPFPDLRPFIPPVSVPGLRFQALSLDTSLMGGFTNIAQ